MEMNKIYQGDCLEVLKTFPDESVNCCITSPPYWGLRDYGTATWEGKNAGCDHKKPTRVGNNCTTGHNTMIDTDFYKDVCRKCGAKRIDNQLGLEKTPEEYVEKMVNIFREVKRILKKDGTVWLNLGDSYCSGKSRYSSKPHTISGKDRGDNHNKKPDLYYHPTLKDKDLVGIPWMVAFALQQPYYTGQIKDEKDRVWLASMIDGEGCMFIHKRKAGQSNGQGYFRKNDTYGAGLEVANTHISIIQRCMEITGMGSICTVERETKYKKRNIPLHRWNMRSNQCRNIIREIYPYLVGKQHEARLLLGCPSSGKDAEKAHASLIALHNNKDTCIDFPPPESMYEQGFYLRQDIIWNKKNPMPESVTDRCTKSHEYIFLLSKSSKYYYDYEAIQEDSVDPESFTGRRPRKMTEEYIKTTGHSNTSGVKIGKTYEKRNKRSVWTVNTKSYKEAHFATYPVDLIVDCIKAGCPKEGIILDPFIGSGTTGEAALRLERKFVGIELNKDYIKLANTRLQPFLNTLF